MPLVVAQRDSKVMAGLGEAAKLDSGAMRTIAVVTTAFLPPTFISVCALFWLFGRDWQVVGCVQHELLQLFASTG